MCLPAKSSITEVVDLLRSEVLPELGNIKPLPVICNIGAAPFENIKFEILETNISDFFVERASILHGMRPMFPNPSIKIICLTDVNFSINQIGCLVYAFAF